MTEARRDSPQEVPHAPNELAQKALEKPIIGLTRLRKLKFPDPQRMVSFISNHYDIPEENFDISPKQGLGAGYSRGTIGLNSTVGSYTIAELNEEGENAGQWTLTEPALMLLLKGTEHELAFSPDEVERIKPVSDVRNAIRDLAELERKRGTRPDYLN